MFAKWRQVRRSVTRYFLLEVAKLRPKSHNNMESFAGPIWMLGRCLNAKAVSVKTLKARRILTRSGALPPPRSLPVGVLSWLVPGCVLLLDTVTHQWWTSCPSHKSLFLHQGFLPLFRWFTITMVKITYSDQGQKCVRWWLGMFLWLDLLDFWQFGQF